MADAGIGTRTDPSAISVLHDASADLHALLIALAALSGETDVELAGEEVASARRELIRMTLDASRKVRAFFR